MFVREGEEHPCSDFPEPFVQDGLLKPGFEIFHDCHTLDEAPHLTKTKTTEILDDQALWTLFNESRPMENETVMTTLALQDEGFDPTRLISPASTLEEIENGWVKTYQWVNAKGIEFKMSTGEGPKFYETRPKA